MFAEVELHTEALHVATKWNIIVSEDDKERAGYMRRKKDEH